MTLPTKMWHTSSILCSKTRRVSAVASPKIKWWQHCQFTSLGGEDGWLLQWFLQGLVRLGKKLINPFG